ncbi:MAG: hypothetical protein M1823_005938 [Watsoniomyces obsoletus]|nr:MAG: hypothetical protein M1823_005938 [Watsoniomyces obsoletus]
MALPIDATIREAIWNGTIPLSIRLSPTESRTYDQTDPYLVNHPRLSYLPFLLLRLRSFFSTDLIDPENTEFNDGWFSFEDVPLRWHYPLGLLHDLFTGHVAPEVLTRGERDEKGASTIRPWEIQVHFTDWPDEHLVRLDAESRVIHDAFINSVKEADFIRNGTAKGIMSLSKEDSTRLWTAVQEHNLSDFNSVNQKLLSTPGASLRHVPIRIYLPTSTSSSDSEPAAGTLRVVQSLVAPMTSPREIQTMGSALHRMLPSLFPSRGTAIFARPVLHGAVVPLNAPIEELMRCAAYTDGWIHLSIVMIG